MKKLPIIAKSLNLQELSYSSWKNIKNHRPEQKYLLLDPKTQEQEPVKIIGGINEERVIVPNGYKKSSRLIQFYRKLVIIERALKWAAIPALFTKIKD